VHSTVESSEASAAVSFFVSVTRLSILSGFSTYINGEDNAFVTRSGTRRTLGDSGKTNLHPQSESVTI